MSVITRLKGELAKGGKTIKLNEMVDAVREIISVYIKYNVILRLSIL